ncbi:MAG: heavy metal translocating P-type ATPase [Candidatus Aenigmatarchaeota archaeon]|nr:heavy metal translocating P-type ATPase [Candidatus Aenigmarchaeota archaeon]
MKNAKLKISGMHCASCSQNIESSLKNSNGVLKANVNLATETAFVEYDENLTNPQKIAKVIENLGYSVIKNDDVFNDYEIKKLKKLFIISIIFTLPVFLISMPFKWFGIEIPYENIILLCLSTPVQFFVGYIFYRGAFYSLKNRKASMDTLIAVGTSAAYFYSVLSFFYPLKFGDHLYFETSTVIITFVILGKWMEALTKGKASHAIKKLMEIRPKNAILLKDGKEIEIDISLIKKDDIIVVKPGMKIPVDGVIIDGYATIDESMLTGESIPVEKVKGQEVFGGTINKNGYIRLKATKIGEETMINQIIKLIEDAQTKKAPIQKIADKISSVFVPVVFSIAVMSFFIWYFVLSQSLYFALSIFISVLIIACPCALGLATPTAIMLGSGKGAEMGILIKNTESIEKMNKIDTVVFDKTGTLTKGKPEVVDVISFGKNNTLLYAAIAEKNSDHPLAEAVIKKAEENGIRVPNPSQFKYIPGNGIVSKYKNIKIFVGNRSLMNSNNIDFKENENKIQEFENQGKTVFLVALNKKLIGLICISDSIKDEAKQVVEILKKDGKEVYMITGDNFRTANYIASQLGINNVIAEVMPNEKENEIKKLQKKGKKVLMIGDGINDAPALARADVSMAIGAGSDIAIETGDIILVKNNLFDAINAINLSKLTMKKIKQNMFWAFFYNSLGIPIAAGALYPFTGFLLNPMIAGVAMAFSSVSVVINSLTIKKFKPL